MLKNLRWNRLFHLKITLVQNRNALRIYRMQRLPDRLAPLGEAAALTSRQLGAAQVLVDLDQVCLQALGCLDDDGIDLGPAQCPAGGDTVVVSKLRWRWRCGSELAGYQVAQG